MITRRIRKIMEYYELSNADFADRLEVQPSNISHILSGRNKPSLDFILKLKVAFPDISWGWILEGRGEMLEKNGKIMDEVAVAPNLTPTLFDLPEVSQKIKIEDSAPIEEKKANVKETRTAKAVPNQTNKAIKSIVFFYEDGSFEQFNPPQT